MNSEKTPLAVRRAHLVAECARQRGDMADQLNLLKAPVERVNGAADFLREHRKSVLAGAGVALGVLIARPKPVLAVLAAGASLWQLGQRALPLVQRMMPAVQRVLPIVRARLQGHLE
ncbi:YqjK family protein [Massilia sp. Leaf139]|uniref:YqjK family protein n=1 Tax=Massilia sp. Leaf139 TaxID=1736272 RepID=UPI0006F482BD|nr:YqjK family protein [Massilia sp. Leaf139]KQQ91867.1 hypothetical protein ASF77_08020 [Massilia sp. Leaf139]